MVDRDHAAQAGSLALREDDKMKVLIAIKVVYGNPLYYPANDAASIFAALAGKKSLSKADIAKIKALGYEVEYVNAYAAAEV